MEKPLKKQAHNANSGLGMPLKPANKLAGKTLKQHACQMKLVVKRNWTSIVPQGYTSVLWPILST